MRRSALLPTKAGDGNEKYYAAASTCTVWHSIAKHSIGNQSEEKLSNHKRPCVCILQHNEVDLRMPISTFSIEVFMNITRITFVSCVLGTLFLAGCQKASEPPQPMTSTSGTVTSPAASVAAPPNTLPPSDAAMAPPAQEAPSSGDAGRPTQVNPSTLSTAQEKATMPHSGQVNNHSVPDTTSQNK